MTTAQTTWGQGEYPLMAEHLEPVAEHLVQEAGIDYRDHVLDLGCGTGSAAHAAAKRGADVVGVDFEPALLSIAADIARRQRLSPHWVTADMVNAPVAEHGFSAIVSNFGVPYVPNADAAAAALSRHAAAGARIALTAWTPSSVMSTMGAALTPFLPTPPPGATPPSRWAQPDWVTDLFGRHRIETTKTDMQTLRLRFADISAASDYLIRTAGHVIRERPRLEREGRWTALQAAIVHLLTTRADMVNDTLILPLDYVVVSARKA